MNPKTRTYAIASLAIALALAFVLAARAMAAQPDPPAPPQAPGVPPGLPQASQEKQPAGPDSISGSFVVFDPEVNGMNDYAPGDTQTLCFRSETFTDDWEWRDSLWLKFPTDWSVSEAYLAGPPTCDNGGSFASFSWDYETSPYEIVIDHKVKHKDPVDHCVATYCVEVTAGASAPDPALVSWYQQGEEYGVPPNFPCSSDGYTPPSQAGKPCDESIHDPAEVPLAGAPWYVDADATGANTGLSWADAFTDLQSALAVASAGDKIWVAEGTYTPTDGADRDISFSLVNEVKVYGGFAGTESVLNERDWRTHTTILSGDIGVIGDPTDNSRHVVTSNEASSFTVLDGFTITDGHTGWEGSWPEGTGGGMLNVMSDPSLRNLVFTGNHAGYGGGMMNITSSPKVVDVVFTGNTAGKNGGGMNNDSGSSPVLANVVFLNNHAVVYAGALMAWEFSDVQMTNVTFTGNSADDSGGAIYAFNSTPLLQNSILWGNSAPNGAQIYNNIGATDIGFSLVQGSGGSGPGWNPTVGTDLGGNIDADPLFVDEAAGDLHLQPLSPAIDAGDNTAEALVGVIRDLDGQRRITDYPFVPDTGNGNAPYVDMGVYEIQADVIYVDVDAAGANTGMNWADAFTDLQSALAIASPTKQVWVAEGVYLPTDGADRQISFELPGGAEVYGGFAGTETSLDERDWRTHATILSGDIGTPGDPSDNTHNVVFAVNVLDVVLDGFTIRDGNADSNNWPWGDGAGAHLVNMSVVLRNLHITGNQTSHYGGGMTIEGNSRVELLNVSVTENSSWEYAAGLFLPGSQASWINGVVWGNEVTNPGWGLGGGIYADGSTLNLTNISVAGNSASLAGGGMYNSGSNVTLLNTVFFGNTAPGDPQIRTDKLAALAGHDGAYRAPAEAAAGAPVALRAEPEISYSLVDQEPCPGVCDHVLTGDPLFVDLAAGDLRLASISPAVDAGDNSAPLLAGVLLDLSGLPRFADVTAVADTGVGPAPVVDMGAYEVQPPVLAMTKTASALSLDEGEEFTYTIRIENSGLGAATEVSVSDALPAGLEFAGPVTLDPPQAGAVLGDPPNIASGLVIGPGEAVTLSFAVLALDGPATIANTASASALELSEAVTATSPVVSVANVAPAVDAGPDQAGDTGTVFDFTAVFSDPGALDTHTYEWDFGDGSNPVTGTLTAQHTYLEAGTYTVTLTVTDDNGGVGADTLTVTVTATQAGYDVYLPLTVRETTPNRLRQTVSKP